jgi:hypothetical protein
MKTLWLIPLLCSLALGQGIGGKAGIGGNAGIGGFYTVPASTYVGGAQHNCGSATTCSVTYAPTSGNTVVGCLTTGNTISAVTFKDSGTNALTVGSTVSATNPENYSYSYVAGAGVTGYTAAWTTSRASTVIVAEYTTPLGGVSSTPTAGTANGTGTTGSVSPTAVEAGDVAVACIATNTAMTQIASNGIIRVQGGTPGIAVVDQPATGATSTPLATTFSSIAWSATALLLKQ